MHVGQGRKILAAALRKAEALQLLPEDRVGRAKDIQFLRRHLADDADGEPGAGEGLAHDEAFRKAEAEPQLADLVLEQQAQRLQNLSEGNDIP